MKISRVFGADKNGSKSSLGPGKHPVPGSYKPPSIGAAGYKRTARPAGVPPGVAPFNARPAKKD